MLLDLDRELSDITILDLIIVGLPVHVQNSLNRNIVTTLKILHNKLKKFEAEDRVFDSNKNKVSGFPNLNTSQPHKGNSENLKKNKIFINSSSEKKVFESLDKKPCSNCTKRGFPNRFHPESNCWFKDKEPSAPKINNIELDSISSNSTSDDDQKN